jgi:hypothetical protein
METWIHPWKHRFVRYLTKHITHFGNIATSRAEGMHSRVKKWLNRSKGSLYTVFIAIDVVIELQLVEIRKSRAYQMQTIQLSSNKLYDEIKRHIPRHAILKIHAQRELSLVSLREKDPLPIGQCSGNWTGSMGLPCKHQIYHLIRSNQSISLAQIDPFWMIVPIPDPSLVQIQPPSIPVPKIRSKIEVLPMLANQVAPSKAFQPLTKRKGPKCSGCGGAHTIRQCGKPPNQKKQKMG